jgi:hypothetical protein
MGAVRGDLRGAIGTLGLRHTALVVMFRAGGGVARLGVIIVTGRRDTISLEEMVHPVRRRIENKEKKRGGDRASDCAMAVKRQSRDDRRHHQPTEPT